MLRLGEKIIIVADSIEQNLPIGDYGYIIAYDRNADSVFEYVIRVPKANKHFYVLAADIELESDLLEQAADRVEKELLIDYALATRNNELFRKVMNGEVVEGTEAAPKEVQSREDFIRQVNLRAWI